MLYPKPLQNYFYFIKDKVVYDIMTSNDKDECGQQLMKETDAENASVFPVIVVKTNPRKKDGTYDTSVTNVYYFWYQYLIKDGDTYDNGTFTMTSHDSSNPDATYIDVVKDGVNADIDTMVAKGYTLDAIKGSLPWWTYAQTESIVNINGNLEKVSENNFAEDFSDTIINEQIMAKTDEMILAYANEKLKKHNKKYCASKILDDTKIKNIDEECPPEVTPDPEPDPEQNG